MSNLKRPPSSGSGVTGSGVGGSGVGGGVGGVDGAGQRPSRPNMIPIGLLGGAEINGFGLLEFVVLSTLLFLLVAVALTILILYRVSCV